MNEIEKLTELISEAKDIYPTIPLVNGCKPEFKYFLADYLLANGAIVPPVKVGQTVYDIGEFLCGVDAPEMYELKDNRITFVKSRDGDYFEYDSVEISHGDLGKTVFLSREEAEKALAERSKGE